MAELTAPRTVVVTGGAGGLGLAMSRRFARAGDRVAVLDLDAVGAERQATALREAGAEAIGLACDVTDFAACEAAFATIRERLGPIDVLINNAGVTHRSLFADTDVAVLERVMRVNWLGAVHCTKAALPDLVAQKGLVVGISSVAGYAPLVGRTGYSASKHALHGFLDSLRAELAPQGVGALLVCPAYIDTPLNGNALDAHGERLGADAPKAAAGGYLDATQVANQVFDAVRRRKRQRLISGVAHLAWWMTRLAPRLYEPLMRRAHRDEFEL
jgi:NAD(P)-dependent dehydrogenase (short-subunit alcohol dehydrogenase family)